MALLAHLPRAVTRIMTVLAAVCVGLAVVASVDPQWIEHSVGLSPDGGSGGAEWELVIAFAAAALVLSAVALAATLARLRLARVAEPLTSQG
jgi:hypothetical protein